MADLIVDPSQVHAIVVDRSQISAAAPPSATPKSDDEIIRQYGFDPATVKKSHLYVPGHLLSVAGQTKPLVTPTAGPGFDDESDVSKQLEGVGEGLYRIPAGLFQLAVHGLNKLGIASDADVQYNDLLEKVHSAAYQKRVGGDPSLAGEIAGGAIVPMPGGATKTITGAILKGAATGAAAASAQPATGNESFADQKLKQAAIGAATGGAIGAVTGATGRIAASRAVELPEQQAARVGAEGSDATAKLEKTMTATPFAGADEVARAAQNGDKRAQALEAQMKAAVTPAQIQQASLGLMNWRTRATATGLYDKVQQAVSRHRGLAEVPLEQTEQAITFALNQAEKAKDPDTSLINLLRTVQRNIGANPDEGAAPGALVDNSYGQIRQFRSDLGDRINALRTGAGKQLLGPSSSATLQGIRDAVDTDLRNFTRSSAPEVQHAADEADKFYAKFRVPFAAPDIAKAGAPNVAGTTTDAEADQIFGKFIQAGRGDKAQRFFNSLDPRGRASVQYQIAADAMNQATDALHGTFDAGKFFSALDNSKEAYGVFFSGPDKTVFDGLKKLAQQAAQGSDAEAARAAKLTQFAGGTGAAAVVAGSVGAHPVAEGLGTVAALAGAARGLMLTDAGRRLLVDASKLKPGDPALARILAAVNSQGTATAARALTSQRNNP